MTDRELLELAAKAAGHRITWGEKYRVGDDEVDCTDLPYVMSDSPDESPCYWNPLQDDGDALRLSSMMCMTIKQDDPNAVVCGWTNTQRAPTVHDRIGPWFWKEWLRDNGNDRTAATRRAIVRAAAVLGGTK